VEEDRDAPLTFLAPSASVTLRQPRPGKPSGSIPSGPLRRGIIFAQGSDYFVTPFATRYGLWASRARETLLGTYGKTPWGTAESIGIRDALKSYTIWAARQLFLETKIGSLEEGKYADIAVWDCDPYTASIDCLKDMGCQLTVFNGRIVYLREGTRITLSRQADSARTRP
jgi:predicted amidohydrolase YtcJ